MDAIAEQMKRNDARTNLLFDEKFGIAEKNEERIAIKNWIDSMEIYYRGVRIK